MIHWVVIYYDGTEYSDDYTAIERQRVSQLCLAEDGRRLRCLRIDATKAFFYRRRVIRRMTGQIAALYFVGYRQRRADKSVRTTVLWLMPDGSFQLSDGFKDGDAYKYTPIFREDERL
jgi:hypothetical protein